MFIIVFDRFLPFLLSEVASLTALTVADRFLLLNGPKTNPEDHQYSISISSITAAVVI